ncbi:MAG: Hsp20/alpha crystallin family protein [Bryobacteraceae bacterium]|nr:Hsp20/alpha crystallin family protein [Bryobacteraceae bacterium]
MPTDTNIQLSEKQEVSGAAEQTREGPVYEPLVDISEDAEGLTLMADMPGVTPERLTIDLRENVLTLRGEVEAPPPNESYVLREYGVGAFYRQFTLADSIDQSRIDARLKDGVLHLRLPKVEKARPRQISVKAS